MQIQKTLLFQCPALSLNYQIHLTGILTIINQESVPSQIAVNVCSLDVGLRVTHWPQISTADPTDFRMFSKKQTCSKLAVVGNEATTRRNDEMSHGMIHFMCLKYASLATC